MATKKNPKQSKDPAAVELGRKGGLKGGPARANKLTPEQRSESARKAVQVRWAKERAKKKAAAKVKPPADKGEAGQE